MSSGTPGLRITEYEFKCSSCGCEFSEWWDCGADEECPECGESCSPTGEGASEWTVPLVSSTDIRPGEGFEVQLMMTANDDLVLVKSVDQLDKNDHCGIREAGARHYLRGIRVDTIGPIQVTGSWPEGANELAIDPNDHDRFEDAA